MIIAFSRENGVAELIDNLRSADAGLQVKMMDQARADLGDTWQQLVNEQITSQQDAAVIAHGTRTIVGATGFVVYAAESIAPLSGGLVPLESWHAVEFGARTRRKTFTTTSRKGKKYEVTKMVNRGLPSRQKFGRVGFRAASEMGTALVRSWMNTMTSIYRDAVGDDRIG